MIMILSEMITILISDHKLRSGILTVVFTALVASAVVGCSTGTGSDRAGIDVVVTTSIWADVARQVVGEDGTVTTVIPIGADAHDYTPSPRQVADLTNADLVLANGLGLEQGFGDVLESAAADGANIVELAPLLDPVPFPDRGDLDPHVWFDPGRVADAANLIAENLTALDDSVDWQARADAYSADLDNADAEITDVLATVAPATRKLVTNHDVLGYFAARYDFEVIGVVIPGGSTLGDPSSAELADLVDVIVSEGVPAIFAETSHTTALAESIAAEVGREVEVVVLGTESLGEPGSETGTLIGMLRSNARLIADALS
jgi:zinc/manganese transport system substrate-binding protein